MLSVSMAMLLAGCGALHPLPEKQAGGTTAADIVLRNLSLQRRDLAIKSAIARPDPFLLQNVNHLLQAPVRISAFAENVETALQKKTMGIAAQVALCANILEAPIEAAQVQAPENTLPEYFQSPAVTALYAALQRAGSLLQEAFTRLDRKEMLFVKETIEHLLFYGDYWQEHTRDETQDMIEKAFQLASRVDLKKITSACYTVAAALDRAMPELTQKPLALEPGRMATPLGDIIIGGYGPDTYTGAMPLLLVDPGGNDTYAFDDYASLSVIIDLAGNDVYKSRSKAFLGAGILGLGVIMDVEGDDRYYGEVFSFGCGFMGAGVVADLAGNDRYESRLFS
ncbi:MAG: hypothetical protein WCQ99_14220, partial [Pseudomonadota bacterium]